MHSTQVIRHRESFWRASGSPADRLKGDAGKTTAAAAAAAAAKMSDSEEILAGLSATDQLLVENVDDVVEDEAAIGVKLARDPPIERDANRQYGWILLNKSDKTFTLCRDGIRIYPQAAMTAEVMDRKTGLWIRRDVNPNYYMETAPTFTSVHQFGCEHTETGVDPTCHDLDCPRSPPAISRKLFHVQVAPDKKLQEPVNVFGGKPHMAIISCDNAEMQHVYKLIVTGEVKNVTPMQAGYTSNSRKVTLDLRALMLRWI